MADRMRVSVLAHELGLTSKDVLTDLASIGEHVKSASSVLEPPVVRRLREAHQQHQAPARVKPTPSGNPKDDPEAVHEGASRPTPLSVRGAAGTRAAARHQVLGLARWTDVMDVIRACQAAQSRGQDLVLDMGGVRFPFPSASVPVAAVIQYFRQRNLRISLANLPSRVTSMRLDQPLEATESNLDTDKIVNTIWSYYDVSQASALAAAVVAHLEKTVPMVPGVHQSLSLCLFEVIDNVLEHSGEDSGYFMTTVHEHGTRLSMAISDTGIGARESFKKSPAHSPRTDFNALTLSVQAGVTSTGDNPRGNGLYTLQRTVESNGGRLEIRSGTGVLSIHGRDHDGHDFWSTPVLSPENRGFFVDWQLDLSSPVDLQDVYGDLMPAPPANIRLEEIENEQEEHVVCVRNHELGLGTRKAAEQLRIYLLNLLDLGASTLVLDFEGVAIVGASFADEVLGKLVEQFGVTGFMRRFELRAMEPGVELLVNRAITLRMGAIRAPAIKEDRSSGFRSERRGPN